MIDFLMIKCTANKTLPLNGSEAGRTKIEAFYKDKSHCLEEVMSMSPAFMTGVTFVDLHNKEKY
jgi:hypothetical protein